MSAWAEIDEDLGYDADHEDSSQYCQHGTFIGSWWGPDYLCQWCEDGISAAEMRRILIAERRYEAEQRLAQFDRLVAAFQDQVPERGFQARWATFLLDIAEDRHWAIATEALT
jgi:hypothetical protein